MKVVAQNRRARFDYEILETLEAGLMLTGPEVKSVRNGGMSLAGAYVSFYGATPFLRQSKIAPYTFAATVAQESERPRALLLKKKEMEKLATLSHEKGVTVIPLEVRAGRFIKVLLGVARGRKTIDKRQAIKKREVERQLRRGEDA